MLEEKVLSHDGIYLNYAISKVKQGKPWLAFIIPFGWKLQMANKFFKFFEPQYNLITWESRSILDSSDRGVSENEFAIENHVMDLHTVLAEVDAKQFVVVGYCSGAGIALAAANRFPRLIGDLVLVHGEYAMLGNSTCTTQFAKEIDSLLSMAARDEEHLNLVFERIKDMRFEEDSGRPHGIDMPFTQLSYFRRYAASYLAYKSKDFELLAKFVTHRAYLMTGNRDVQTSVASTEKIADLMPYSEVYIDPEADHYGVLREGSNTMIAIWNYLCERRLSCV